jgi:hypothetical protein
MKKLFIISAIAASGLVYNAADAQINLRVGLGFRPRAVVYAQAQVAVNQSPAYDGSDDYYYLPDVDAYYDVTGQCYFYFDGNEWISAQYLPGTYANYDWRNARRIELRCERPYLNADFYRSKYNGRRVEEFMHRDYDNHRDGGYANRVDPGYNTPAYHQPAQQNRGGDQHFNVWGQGNNRPAQPNKDNGQRFDNRDKGNSQPSNQNNGHDNNKGGTDHIVKNSRQGGFNAHKMTRF